MHTNKSPLYRKVNTLARGVNHHFGGDFRHERRGKQGADPESTRSGMHGRSKAMAITCPARTAQICPTTDHHFTIFPLGNDKIWSSERFAPLSSPSSPQRFNMSAKKAGPDSKPGFNYIACLDLVVLVCIAVIASRPDGLAITINAIIVAIVVVLIRSGG